MNKLGIIDFGYYIVYLDSEYNKVSQFTNKQTLRKFVYTNQYTAYIEITPNVWKWEKKYLNTLIIETLFLLIKTDIAQHLKSISTAFNESTKLNTFINHDIKNITQFISILEHNLQNLKDDSDQKRIVSYLKETTPALKIKSDRIIAALKHSADDNLPEWETVNPAELAHHIASIFKVELEIEDEFNNTIFTDKHGLIVIFENIIKNFYDKKLKEKNITLNLRIRQKEKMLEMIFSDTGSQINYPEKIFEPFYTEKEHGLGVGLYHSRTVAKKMGIHLSAQNIQGKPSFILSLIISN
jgi:signal transduction histidine kinase